MKYRDKKTTCCRTGCKNERRPGQRTCKSCHAADSRKYRQERVYVRRDQLQAFREIA